MKLNNKGFTLIELVITTAIISIILLLAIPSFTPYKIYLEDNKLKHEILEVEHQIKKVVLQNDLDIWKEVSEPIEQDLWTSNGVYENTKHGIYIEIPNNLINTKLEGGFYLNNGRVYYSKFKLKVKDRLLDEGDNSPVELDKSILFNLINIAKGLNSEDYEFGWLALIASLEKGEQVYLSEHTNQGEVDMIAHRLEQAINELENVAIKWELAEDKDFVWRVELIFGYRATWELLSGYYKYVGTKEYIILPEYIRGNRMTNLRYMFEGNKTIKGVMNNNNSSKQLYRTFSNINIPSLDLSKFDVSEVQEFTETFKGSTINSLLDLNGWNNSSAKYMDKMFREANIGHIVFGSFDINNVLTTNSMFRDIETDILHINNFDLTNRRLNMNDMFRGTIANKIIVKN